MADITIAKPAAGENVSIASESGARFVFDFPTSDATLARDGDNLAINFADGSQVNIENFYTEYNADNLPAFSIDGEEVSAEDFFTAMNEPDLLPAAGPGTGPATAAADGARYHSYENMALMGGIEHLNDLDWNTSRAFTWEEMPNSVGPDSEDAPYYAVSDATPAETPEITAPQTPLQPVEPPRQVTPVQPEPDQPITPDRPVDINPPTPDIPVPDVPEVPVVPDMPPMPGRPNDTPELNNPPYDPDGDPDRPGNPGDPDDPDRPTDGEPPAPRDPEDPQNPDNPDNPHGDSFIPATGNSHVVVDEGAYLRGHGGALDGNHTAHGYIGSYQFTARVPEEEGGQITLSGVDADGNAITYVCVVPVGINSELYFSAYDAAGNPIEGEALPAFMASGIVLSNFAITPNGGGNYTITYDYELTRIQEHDVNHSSDQGHDGSESYVSDNVLFRADAVDILVRDGSGDQVQSQIKVEVHDDVPYIYVKPEDNGDGTVSNNAAIFDFGADNYSANGVDYGSGIQRIELEVAHKNEQGELVYAKYEGDLSQLDELANFAGVSVTVDHANGRLVFNYAAGTEDADKINIPIRVTVIDADGDPDTVNLLLAPPKIHNDPKNPDKPTDNDPTPPADPDDPDKPTDNDPTPPTDPDDPDKPGDPDDPHGDSPFIPATGQAHVVVDEGALPGGSGAHKWHGTQGVQNFTVEIPVEEGGHITLSGVDADNNPVILQATITAAGEIIDFHAVDAQGKPVEGDGVFFSNGIALSGFTVSKADAAGVWSVDYSYELQANQTHDRNGQAAENASYSSDAVNLGLNAVQITVQDGTGDVARGQINVEVHDDAPAAVNDFGGTLGIVRDAAGKKIEVDSASGNVLTNDAAGADGLASLTWENASDGVIQGDYGQLVLGADGAWTYRLNTENEAYKGLKFEDAPLRENFNYTITDADGDISSATLTLNIKGNQPVTIVPRDPDPGVPGGDPAHPEIPDASVTVREEFLPNGSNAGKGSLTQEGILDINAPDGVKSISLGGYDIPVNGAKITINTDEGSWTVSFDQAHNQLNYSFTLARDTQEHGAPGKDQISHDLQLVVMDNDGDSANSTLRVNVVDDVPQAQDDAHLDTLGIYKTDAGVKVSNLTASGNVVLNDTVGADGLQSVTWQDAKGNVIQGTYGKLILGENGAWEYELDPENANYKELKYTAQATETFNYTIKDNDGDTSSAKLTLNIRGNQEVTITSDGKELGVEGAAVEVHEEFLSGGSKAGKGALEQGGVLDINAPDGVKSISLDGHDIPVNGTAIEIPVPADGGSWTVSFDQASNQLKYSFTLTEASKHPDQGPDTKSHSLQLVVTDNNDDSAIAKLTANIVDDVPQAVNDEYEPPLGAFKTDDGRNDIETSAKGNVLENDTVGADGLQFVTWDEAVGKVIKGTYGTLKVGENGDWEYELAQTDPDYQALTSSTAATETFTYTITDQDGDTSSATLTLNIRGNQLVTIEDAEATVYEGDLEGGTHRLIEAAPALLAMHSENGANQIPDAEDASASQWNEKLTDSGEMKISALDGLGSIKVIDHKGNVHDINLNGTEETIIQTDEGEWKISFNKDSGNLDYKFTLIRKTDHEEKENQGDEKSHSLTVEVTDKDGDSATGTLKATIVDDAPVFTPESGEKCEGVVSFGSITGMETDFTDADAGTQAKMFESLGFDAQKGIYFEPSSSTGDWVANGNPNSKSSNLSQETRPISSITKYSTENGSTTPLYTMTSSFVHYHYVYKEGTSGLVEVDNVIDISKVLYKSGKAFHIDENGLSVGGVKDTAWNSGSKVGEISPNESKTTGLLINTADKTNYGRLTKAYPLKDDGNGGKTGVGDTLWSSNVSEAVVFDLPRVAYGVDFTLGSLSDGDRIVVTFMFAPPNNSDDKIVKILQLTVPDKDHVLALNADGELQLIDLESVEDLKQVLDHDGNLNYEMTNGFTKVFVSAIPKDNYVVAKDGLYADLQGEASTDSGFTIKTVDFLNPVWEGEGNVEAISADGIESYAWDWSSWLTQDENGKWTGTVTLDGAISGEKYQVEIEQDGTAKILLKETGNKWDQLFKATLGEDGHWSLTVNYKFTPNYKDGEQQKSPFAITAQDGDGDINKQVLDVTPKFGRFDNTMNGSYRLEWMNGNQYDQASDYMAGGTGNDLMYGKGGHDFLVGDGGEEAVKQILAQIELNEDASNKIISAVNKVIDGKDDREDGFAWDTNGQLTQQAFPDGNNKTERADMMENLAQKLQDEETSAQLANKLENIEQAHQFWDGDDAIYGGEGNDIIFGMGGNDELFGGEGKDFLFGGGGDDYIDGGADKDTIYAGSGNDLIVFDQNDILIDGGNDIDFLLADTGTQATLKDLLNNGDQNDNPDLPKVRDVEVLIKGDLKDVTQVEDLAAMGITFNNEDMSLSLDERWENISSINEEDSSLRHKTVIWAFKTNESDSEPSLTLETTLSVNDHPAPGAEVAPEPAMLFTMAARPATLAMLPDPSDDIDAESGDGMPEYVNADPDSFLVDDIATIPTVSDAGAGAVTGMNANAIMNADDPETPVVEETVGGVAEEVVPGADQQEEEPEATTPDGQNSEEQPATTENETSEEQTGPGISAEEAAAEAEPVSPEDVVEQLAGDQAPETSPEIGDMQDEVEAGEPSATVLNEPEGATAGETSVGAADAQVAAGADTNEANGETGGADISATVADTTETAGQPQTANDGAPGLDNQKPDEGQVSGEETRQADKETTEPELVVTATEKPTPMDVPTTEQPEDQNAGGAGQGMPTDPLTEQVDLAVLTMQDNTL